MNRGVKPNYCGNKCVAMLHSMEKHPRRETRRYFRETQNIAPRVLGVEF